MADEIPMTAEGHELVAELRARIAQLEKLVLHWSDRCKFASAEVERLTAENAELSSHLEEATQSGIDTAREITETLSKRLDEVEAENAGLKSELQTARNARNSLYAENAGLREENARLRGAEIEYPRGYGPGDAARGAK